MGIFRTQQERLNRRLISAARMGDLQKMETLINLGADVDAKDGDGMPALICALSWQHQTAALLLIRKKAKIDCRDKKGNTPLHWAISLNLQDVLEKLIALKAPVNQGNLEDYTPLHIAADKGNYTAVQALLGIDADPTLRTIYGDTAADLARDIGFNGLARLLERKTRPEVPLGWHVTNKAEKEITRVSAKPGYCITEIFNFAAGTYTKQSRNLETDQESTAIRMFYEFASKTPLEEARAELERNRVSVNPTIIYAPPPDWKKPL